MNAPAGKRVGADALAEKGWFATYKWLLLRRCSQFAILALFLTGTTLSVPALTGAIMTIGVSTANSILMVSFARQRLSAGEPPLSAALEAGATRLRPVLMTALAMIMGMLPMAIGLGEGGEQNAPLGRAAIGGLLFATLSTLIFVPLVFASVHQHFARRATDRARPNLSGLAEGNS